MASVLGRIEDRRAAFGDEPLQRFLRDETISPDRRLAMAAGMTHFVMSFTDLCLLVLREEPARDRYQELVNAHAKEDCDHYMWFLDDLCTLAVRRLVPPLCALLCLLSVVRPARATELRLLLTMKGAG